MEDLTVSTLKAKENADILLHFAQNNGFNITLDDSNGQAMFFCHNGTIEIHPDFRIALALDSDIGWHKAWWHLKALVAYHNGNTEGIKHALTQLTPLRIGDVVQYGETQIYRVDKFTLIDRPGVGSMLNIQEYRENGIHLAAVNGCTMVPVKYLYKVKRLVHPKIKGVADSTNPFKFYVGRDAAHVGCKHFNIKQLTTIANFMQLCFEEDLQISVDHEGSITRLSANGAYIEDPIHPNDVNHIIKQIQNLQEEDLKY